MAFRNEYPDVSILAIESQGSEFVPHELCDRKIMLPIGGARWETAAAIGMQMCLNEGHVLVGAVSSFSVQELATAAICLKLLATDRADAIVVKGHGRAPDCLFASARASFACSFWSAMATGLADTREEVLAQVFSLIGRKLVTMRKDASETCDRSPSPDGLKRLSARAGEISRVIGLRIGQFSPPRSNPVRKIAVITPYYKEPDAELERCLASVRNQSHPCDHFMVSDGFPSDIVRRDGVAHIELGVSHSDNGNTPRYVGGLVALALGYDGIAYLDADNWLEKSHVKRLVETQHQTSANATCSFRNIYLPDGHKLPDMDREDINRLHVDTSCYLLTRDCEFLAHLWGQMPRSWGPVCDRVAFSALQGYRLAWTGSRTLNFKSNYRAHFKNAGKPLPEKIHDVPHLLWKAFAMADAEFRAESISRTGRVIRIMNPYQRAKKGSAT